MSMLDLELGDAGYAESDECKNYRDDDSFGINGYVESLILESSYKFDYFVEVEVDEEQLEGRCLEQYVRWFHGMVSGESEIPQWKSTKKGMPMIAISRSTYDEISCQSRYSILLAMKKLECHTFFGFRGLVVTVWGKRHIRSAKHVKNEKEWWALMRSKMRNRFGLQLPIDSLQIF